MLGPPPPRSKRRVCFADVRPEMAGGWELRIIPRVHGESVMEGKRFKCLPHRRLPNYDYSIWMDANIRMTAPPLFFLQFLRSADIALMPHPDRRCAYREAKICRDYRLDKLSRIKAQEARYRRAGFPERWGLWDCSFIVRRHTPEVNVLGELWYEEIRKGSARDQISFPFVCWKMGIRVANLPFRRGRKNKYVRHRRHRKKRR